MTFVRYDHCDFYEYDGRRMVRIATASLIGGKVVFEGVAADSVEKMVRQSDDLKPYLKKGGYTLLAQMEHAFCGSYFRSTGIIRARLI